MAIDVNPGFAKLTGCVTLGQSVNSLHLCFVTCKMIAMIMVLH